MELLIYTAFEKILYPIAIGRR